MGKVKKVLAYENQVFYWKEGNVYTKFGVVKGEDLEKENISEVNTSTGKKFFVFQPTIIDQLRKIKRGPQTLLLKDLATITTYSGINNESVVLDAGAGCGLLAIFLARIAKKVTTYENNLDHLEIAKKNIGLLEIKNVELK
ncbi:methyltransferase, partial [Candidatus Woesearchaeota archaeon]|nr:methyltransferase [Candidatus Woesearchaeota archaeon]